MSAETIASPQVRELPDIEAAQLFDRQCRELTGLTGDQFVARWRAGAFADTEDDNVMHMLMLLPLVLEMPPTALPASGPGVRVGAFVDDWVSRLRHELRRMRERTWPGKIPMKR